MAKDGSWPERGVIAAPSGGASTLWGECKGSGSKPYQAAVHLDGGAGPAYKCGCPSRKIPCKHVLALLVLWAQDSVDVRDDRPEWVAAWLSGRAARQARARKGTTAHPVDPKKAAATLEAREKAVEAGLEELRLWLYDQVDAGLAKAPEHGYGHWDRMAKRLVDAKAGGAASLVSELPGAARGDRWPERLLERLSLLHLLISAYLAGNVLGERTRGAARAHVGVIVRADDVIASGERVHDTWRVLGQRDTVVEDDMRARRLWLRGTRTGRTALSLAFARPGQTPDTPFRAGTDVTAEFAFYPDGHRIVPVGGADARPAPPPEGGTVGDALDAFAAAVSEDPWRDSWPVVLDQVAPAHDGRWYLTDPTGAALPLATAEPWRLLAVTGGHPATVAAEWSPREGLTPIALWGPQRKDGLPVAGTRTPDPLDPLDPLAPADSWDRLVSTALIGTSRRAVPDTPDLPATPGAEGAAALLDRAALATVRRAAGHTPVTGIATVTPDSTDGCPEVDRAATERLESILQGRLELLPEWLGLVAASGRRVAHSSIPALLDQGARDSQLRPVLSTAVGTRGHWLSRFKPSWAYIQGEAVPGGRFSEPDWEHGTPGERRRSLAALRSTDPDRARGLLAAAWPDLRKAELRRRLLETLGTGLGPADEAFLEQALDDKGANVRGLALSLLTRLPGSAHAERLRGHVRASSSLGGGGALLTDPLRTHRADVRRDLALAEATEDTGHPGGGSERSERLWALITHTPLDVWPGLLGTDPAGVLTAAEKETSPQPRMLDAFVNAIVVQADTEWARAALGMLGLRIARRSGADGLRAFQLEKLLGLLPAKERCEHVRGVLTDAAPLIHWGGPLHAARGPWTRELSEQVIERLHTKGRTHDHNGYREVCEAAAGHMPPEHVAGLHDHPPFDGSSADAYLRLRDTLRFRLDMHREL